MASSLYYGDPNTTNFHTDARNIEDGQRSDQSAYILNLVGLEAQGSHIGEVMLPVSHTHSLI
jgi:hypothetical protein